MTALRLVGTVLWVLLLLTFGSLALSTGYGWAWGLLLVTLAAWVGLVVAASRPRHTAASLR